MHQRDQLAGDEWKGNKNRSHHDSWNGEDHPDIVRDEPLTQPSLQPKNEHEDQARNDRADRERQVNQGEQHTLAMKIELRDHPGGSHSEDEIKRHADRGSQQSQSNGSQRIGLRNRLESEGPALGKRFHKHAGQWDQQEHCHENP